jgi:hypothetical protein
MARHRGKALIRSNRPHWKLSSAAALTVLVYAPPRIDRTTRTRRTVAYMRRTARTRRPVAGARRTPLTRKPLIGVTGEAAPTRRQAVIGMFPQTRKLLIGVTPFVNAPVRRTTSTGATATGALDKLNIRP